MKRIRYHLMLFAVALGLAASAVRADQFELTYTFGGGYFHGGAGNNLDLTFDGTESGNLITGVTNWTLSIDNVQIAQGNTGPGFSGQPATISLDGTQNNFYYIAPGDTLYFYAVSGSFADAYDGGNWMVFLYDTQQSPNILAFDENSGYAYGGDPINASWHVTDLSSQSSVPDGGTTAAMLGAGMIGLVALRRKLAKL